MLGFYKINKINYPFFNIGKPVLEFSTTTFPDVKLHAVDLESFEK